MAEIVKCGDRRCKCHTSRPEPVKGPGVPRSRATAGTDEWLAALDDLIGPADPHHVPAFVRAAA